MGENMTEWEQRKANATGAWTAMSKDQQKAVMDFMEAWVPIRFAISEMTEISYNDLCKVDNSWWAIRHNLVDSGVEVPQWP